jgi:hypothetical protein
VLRVALGASVMLNPIIEWLCCLPLNPMKLRNAIELVREACATIETFSQDLKRVQAYVGSTLNCVRVRIGVRGSESF